MLEVRFHGRGGQGAVTAANLLASAALRDGKKGVQSFPHFGGERRGAPVAAFVRIADEEVRLRSRVYHPDIVVVMDRQTLESTDVTAGVKEGGTIIINSRKKPDEFEFSDRFRVAVVDAAGISIARNLLVSGIPALNTPMLGVVARMTDDVSLESIQEVIRLQWKGKPGEANAEAAREAYDKTEVNR
ncbi:MAG: 2-oxoacid:acceptor oxidoreductase family protein [Dehalococcoidia bacterium]|nr:2-oxoacid:acceptor oxidoreductase family protein [Dehalococcoidia bacterium]